MVENNLTIFLLYTQKRLAKTKIRQTKNMLFPAYAENGISFFIADVDEV